MPPDLVRDVPRRPLPVAVPAAEPVPPAPGDATPVWPGLAVFVVRERAAGLVDEAVAGIARGLEILEVVILDGAQRAAVRERFADWGAAGRPVPAGGPHTVVVACDVAAPEGVTSGVRDVAARIAEVRAHTTRRVLREVSPRQAYEPLQVSASPRQALTLVEALGDEALTARIQESLRALTEACAVPFPLVRMLAPESPGFRSRVALVDHPRHGRTVCKIFRPGAAESFRRELHARQALADLPETPELLEHGENWLLTPYYTDTGRHRLRSLPVKDMSQLRPDASAALARFARALHARGLFILDLSPHNLVSDAEAGLKVLDLEFVFPYPGEEPPATSWSFRGVPRALRRPCDEYPDLPLTKGVGNAAFHPAVAGLPVERLLGPRGPADEVRRIVVQLAWRAALAVLGPLHAALAGRR